MGTYITDAGFQKQTLATIKARLITKFQTLFGPQIDTSDEGPTGQIISTFAKELADEWDVGQETYSSYDPAAATGAALDRVCNLTGVYRIAAAASTSKALLYTDTANLGVTITSGRQARRVRGAVVFSLSANVAITSASCQDIYLKLPNTLTVGATISLQTTFGTFSTVVPAGADPVLQARTVLEALALQINSSSWGVPVLGSVVGEAQVCEGGVAIYPSSPVTIGVQSQVQCLRLVHTTAPFGLVSFGDWTILLCGTQGLFTCTTTGPVQVLPGDVSQIITPETGWVAVTNLVSGVTGRDIETDEELRIRRAASFGTGLATETAILNYLYANIPGIVSASVVSNRTMVNDSEGRPPKSFEVTIQGGDPQVIAKAIWTSMPAGILSYGRPGSSDSPQTIVDSQGNNQSIAFTRPTALPIWVKIQYQTYPEEVFPADGVAQIRAAVLKWAGTEFAVGKNVFAGRFNVPIYETVPGIGALVVKVGTTSTPTDSTIDVSGAQYAFLADERLTVEVLP